MFHHILNIIENGASNINNLCKFLKKINNNSKLEYSKKVRNILKKYGSKKILALRVYRQSINALFDVALNLISIGDYNNKMKKHNIDNCYHVWFEIEVENINKNIIFEKNNVINAYTISKNKKNARYNDETFINIELNKKNNITLKNFFNNGLVKIGKTNYFKYNLSNFNCQTWCLKLLQANEFDNPIYKNFIEQSFYGDLKNKEIINKLVSFFNFDFNVPRVLYYLKGALIILLLLILIMFYFIFKNMYTGIMYFIKVIKPIKISFADYHYELN
jgi:hypothetical protein